MTLSPEVLLVAAVNIVLGAIAFGSIKADTGWIKRIINDHHERITHLERKKEQ